MKNISTDQQWVKLMQEAKNLGLTAEQVREWIQQQTIKDQ